jgi:uncharacterized membrane protein
MKKYFPQLGLLLLSFVPVAAGIKRLAEILGQAEITPANERFLNAPISAVLHIIAIAIFAILGAFQFVPSLRYGKDAWHKLAGKLLIPTGFTVAFTGLWLTAFYPWPPGDGAALYWTRWIVGLWMLVSLGAGLYFLVARNFMRHGDWMLRAYAIGMGAGTQVLTHLPWFATHGTQVPPEGLRAVMMGAGWVINFMVAEWLIARKRRPQLAAS